MVQYTANDLHPCLFIISGQTILRGVCFKTAFGNKHKNPHFRHKNNKKICTVFLSKFVLFIKRWNVRQSINKTLASYEYSKYVEQTICPTEATHISDNWVWFYEEVSNIIYLIQMHDRLQSQWTLQSIQQYAAIKYQICSIWSHLLVNVNINHVTHTVQRRTPIVFRTAFKRMTFIST
jgi:hypothetical protein